jgi:hypothetical protein
MLHPLRFLILAFVLLAAIGGVGVVHGLWTERWASIDLNQEIAEMDKIPVKVGAWEGKTIWDESTRAALPDAANCLVRRYVNHLDGNVASVLVSRGRPGPMVIKHLPTECYPSNGYTLIGAPKRYLSPRADSKITDDFWVATFKKTTDIAPITVRVYWSWSGNGHWQIPDRPRLTFASSPTLYKLYVTQNLHDENDVFEGAPVHEFIKDLTLSLRGSLFPSAQP